MHYCALSVTVSKEREQSMTRDGVEGKQSLPSNYTIGDNVKHRQS